MIELVTVIVVMGILSAIGAAKFFDNSGFQTREYADQVKATIRYGQKLAIAQNRLVYVSATGSRVGLCFTAACTAGSEVQAPGGSNSGSTVTKAQCQSSGTWKSSWMCEGQPTGVTLTSTSTTEAGGSGAFFFFDRMGRPYKAADAPNASVVNPVVSGSTFTSQLKLTYNGSGNTYDILIEPETGYVH